MIQRCTDPQVYITVISDVDSFGVQDKNTNTRCNPTLYTKGHGHQVKPSGAYWPYMDTAERFQ